MKNSKKVSLSKRKIVKIFIAIIALLSLVGVYNYQEKSKQLSILEDDLTRAENLLNTLYLSLDNYFTEANVSVNETKTMADSALKAVVCSDANRYNNKAHESYTTYCTYIQQIEDKLPSYQKKYEECVDLINEINNLEKVLGIDKSSKLSVITYDEMEIRAKALSNENTGLVTCLNNSQAYADKLYKEYYPLMLPLVTGEAGDYYYPDIDQFYVMNVAENRRKSPYYPNTIREVIFQPGQYQPTWDGSWNKEADQRTKDNVEKYLRGYVETGMPDNIVYQAMFKQGDYVWKYVENPVDGGHYYCAKA